jgi:hypothetical protein
MGLRFLRFVESSFEAFAQCDDVLVARLSDLKNPETRITTVPF